MSARNQKKSPAGPDRTRRKRDKEKAIRLADLIPKDDVSGGKRLVFGVTDASLDEPRKKKEN